LVLLPASGLRAADKETLLHNFNGADGINPGADLISDAAGNLYGTTYYGGSFGAGAVFELESHGKGMWVQKVLYSFSANTKDGYEPKSGLILDTAGNLYGTTTHGGAAGGGIAFELIPNGNGGWDEKVLHSFATFNKNLKDGSVPYGGLVLDRAGNLYGTTYYGGSGQCQAFETTVGCGTVFELTPKGNGNWTETVLYSFSDGTGDGHYCPARLVRDTAGNLYGTTFAGGTSGTACGGGGCGTVFKLTPGAKGTWSETIVHNFNNDGRDGYEPTTGLIVDKTGNLYGTTPSGGGGCPGGDCGVAFELTPRPGGNWTESVLHTFLGSANDGQIPLADLISNKAGNLYGTTLEGGSAFQGAAFELIRQTKGNWIIKLLHSFDYGNGGGYAPSAGLAFDKAGNLYGTTYFGGTNNDGVIFEITP
jgi:uncharacterized repeat protein (TIGR03803 family)